MALRLYVRNLPNGWSVLDVGRWVVGATLVPEDDVNVYMFPGKDRGADMSSAYVHLAHLPVAEGQRLAAMPGCTKWHLAPCLQPPLPL